MHVCSEQSNIPVGESARVYDARPKRQSTITEWAGQAADVVIDDNTRLLLALNVFFDSEENFERVSPATVMLL